MSSRARQKVRAPYTKAATTCHDGEMSDERKKASDLFNESHSVFGRKAPFVEVFPDIAEVRVEWTETADGHKRGLRRATEVGEYINCSSGRCYGGGFSIGAVLREMYRARETEREGSELCRGYEGSPKGKRRHRDCLNFFQYKVRVTYRAPSGEGSPTSTG